MVIYIKKCERALHKNSVLASPLFYVSLSLMWFSGPVLKWIHAPQANSMYPHTLSLSCLYYVRDLQILRQGWLRGHDFLNTKWCARVKKRHFGGKTEIAVVILEKLGWFSNRTGTSVDDGARKSNNWLDQSQRSQSGKLDPGSSV